MPFEFTELAQKILSAGLVPADELEKAQAGLGAKIDDAKLMELLIASGRLTKWHVAQLQSGKERGYFLEHYKLMEPIGAGGMGQVFRAIDTELNRQVAVKILPRRSASRSAIERFRREGQAALQVQHEHLVRSFELGQSGETHFLVMELVVGTNLAKYIEKKGKLGVQETARIGYEVALALDHARELGIIHRDIKPSNILINRKGGVKVADLGLARFFGQAPGEQRPQTLTQSGAFMGTLDYCAPEQAEDAKRADTRSDLYSLGCTLYHCLTGQPPFPRGTDVQKIVAHREHEPTPVHELNSEVPQSFSDMIHRRMLAKRPDERFQTPAEAATALHRWISGEPASDDLSLLGNLIEDELGADTAERPSTKPAVRHSSPRSSAESDSPSRTLQTHRTWAMPGSAGGPSRRRRIEVVLIPIVAIVVIAASLAFFFGPWRSANPSGAAPIANSKLGSGTMLGTPAAGTGSQGATGASQVVSRAFQRPALPAVEQRPLTISTHGLPIPKFLESETMRPVQQLTAWRQEGTFGRIRGAGEMSFPLLAVSEFAIDLSLTFENEDKDGLFIDLRSDRLADEWVRFRVIWDVQKQRVARQLYWFKEANFRQPVQRESETEERLEVTLLLGNNSQLLFREGEEQPLRQSVRTQAFHPQIQSHAGTDVTIHRFLIRALTEHERSRLKMPKPNGPTTALWSEMAQGSLFPLIPGAEYTYEFWIGDQLTGEATATVGRDPVQVGGFNCREWRWSAIFQNGNKQHFHVDHETGIAHLMQQSVNGIQTPPLPLYPLNDRRRNWDWTGTVQGAQAKATFTLDGPKSVTVPLGTFEAYVMKMDYSDVAGTFSHIQEDTLVPGIGLVRSMAWNGGALGGDLRLKSVNGSSVAPRTAGLNFTALSPRSSTSQNGATITKQSDDSLIVSGTNPNTDIYTIVAHTNLTKVSALLLQTLRHTTLPRGGPGRSEGGNFVLTGLEISAAPQGRATESRPVMISDITADYAQNGFPARSVLNRDRGPGWAIGDDRTLSPTALIQFQEPVGFDDGTVFTIILKQEYRKPGQERHNIGCFRLSVTSEDVSALANTLAGATGADHPPANAGGRPDKGQQVDTNSPQDAGVRNVFRAYDTNGDNRLSRNEVLAYFRGTKTKDANKAFETTDTNHDGFISMEEWIGLFTQTKPSSAQSANRSFAGKWRGQLGNTSGGLRATIEISRRGTAWSGQFITLDQGNQAGPITAISWTDTEVHFEVAFVQGVYDGKWSADGSEIIGEWKQPSIKAPMTLRRDKQR